MKLSVPRSVATLRAPMARLEPLWIACLVTRSRVGDFRALLRTLRRWNPGYRVALLVVDGVEREAIEGVETVLPGDLGLPDLRAHCFQYDAFELCNSLKPVLMRHVIRTFGAAGVVYMDCDMGVYSDLGPVVRELEEADILVVPHSREDPPEDGLQPGARMMRTCGVFNAGFVGVSSRPEAMRFLDWWASNLRHDCLKDSEAGLFVDQRFLDWVPARFPTARVCRHPGLDVAHFNLHERELRREGDRWCVGDVPLVVFHFTSIDYAQARFVGPINRPFPRQQALIAELVAEFHADRRAVEADALYGIEYGFARFASGRWISPETRVLFREWWVRGGQPLTDPFSDPLWERVERGRRFRQVAARLGVRLQPPLPPLPEGRRVPAGAGPAH